MKMTDSKFRIEGFILDTRRSKMNKSNPVSAGVLVAKVTGGYCHISSSRPVLASTNSVPQLKKPLLFGSEELDVAVVKEHEAVIKDIDRLIHMLTIRKNELVGEMMNLNLSLPVESPELA
jgi:hypothetical protein